MKNLFLLLLCFYLAPSLHAQFNTSFQLSSGQIGTQYGYKTGKFCPYAGLNLSNKIESVNRIFGIDTSDTRQSANNIGINLGLKYAVFEGEKVTAWMDLGINKNFRFERAFVGGELQENDIYRFNYWGGGLAFQVEYFFNEQISIGTAFKVGLDIEEVKSEDLQRDMYTISRTIQNYSRSLLVLNFYF